jgi:Polysulphide reductase, NrfD
VTAPEQLHSYYEQPVLKEPVWTWEIPTYFYTGGLAGASAALAYLSELRGNEVLGRRAWGTAMLAVATSPALLTSDLGKPMRFVNMLRMVKLTSPMSLGSWILVASGATTGIAAANEFARLFPRLSRAARPLAAILGLPLSTYTAALVANTAVPVWHEAHRQLPFVFGSGAALSAGAAAVMTTPPSHARPARRLALAGAALELASKELMEKRLGELGEPFKQGAASKFGHLARASILAGATLLGTRGRKSHGAAIAAGALLSAGALSARWSVFKAGFQSAADPKYVVGPQRTAIERGHRTGASRSEAKVTTPEPAIGSPGTADVRQRELIHGRSGG